MNESQVQAQNLATSQLCSSVSVGMSSCYSPTALFGSHNRDTVMVSTDLFFTEMKL